MAHKGQIIFTNVRTASQFSVFHCSPYATSLSEHWRAEWYNLQCVRLRSLAITYKPHTSKNLNPFVNDFIAALCPPAQPICIHQRKCLQSVKDLKWSGAAAGGPSEKMSCVLGCKAQQWPKAMSKSKSRAEGAETHFNLKHLNNRYAPCVQGPCQQAPSLCLNYRQFALI